MFATILCATNIISHNPGSVLIEGLNNTFGVPFTPTMFSFDVSAVISQMSRNQEHNLKVYLTDKNNNSSLLIDLLVPLDPEASHITSTTFSSSIKNVTIFQEGEHEISVHIDDVEIGTSKLLFIKENN